MKKDINEIRHSLAHLLAAAVLKKFPNAKLGIGPTIENGFYYDFLIEADESGSKRGSARIKDEDLPEIESEMRKLISLNLDFGGEEITPAQAKKLFKDQPFKLELTQEFAKEKKQLTVYCVGPKTSVLGPRSSDYFMDLCRGGHIKNTSEIDPSAFKLTSIAGAYWRGSEKNPQLTRIYGVAFRTKKELGGHLKMLEEAKKRDHRKLGKDLGLFMTSDEVGPGLPLFYPKGVILRRIVENFITELQEKRGYLPIWIPHITKSDLYKTSGHLEKYDALFPPMKLKDEADYYIKPMNCPHFMVLYKSEPRSYRDLPIRWTTTTTNYRYEKSGELSGLTRVRALTQDDCHVFAAEEQIAHEINLMLDMVEETYAAFGFKDFRVRVSTHDPKNLEKYIGDSEIWKKSEETLEELIKKRDWKYEVVSGEAAFYGPKLDFIFKDVIGREWQLSTIQLDMNLPKRFSLEYVDNEGKKREPIVIHRAILGSTERFFGILIEHFAGAFPLWLSPIQVIIVPVGEKFNEYGKSVLKALQVAGVRAHLDESNETLGKKIRNAELQKIPYVLVVGEKEEKNNSVNMRHYKRGQEGEMKIEKLLEKLKEEIELKSI